MKRLALLTMLATVWVVAAQQPVADLLLSNGKIITVDERFSIAQAIAVTRPCERQAVKRSGKPHRQPEGPFAGLSELRLDPEWRCCRDLPLSTCEQQNHAQSESAAEHAWLHLPASLARADEVRSC